MLAKIAKLYYEHEYTHQEIADLLGLSRIKVTRALAEARQQEIVEIRVRSDEHLFIDEELALTSRFGLTQAWVSPPLDAGDPRHLAITGAQAAAQLIQPGHQVGVGISSTLSAVAEQLTPQRLQGTEFVPLNGATLGHVDESTPSSIAASFAAAYGGTARNLAAPVFVASADTYEVMRNDRGLQSAFDAARRSDLALVGVGGMTESASIFVRRELNPDEIKDLRQAGAVGDINARFFDQSGQPVDTPRTELVLGLSLDDLSQIPMRVAVAAGPEKVDALRGALHGGLLTHLVTDQPTAAALLADGS